MLRRYDSIIVCAILLSALTTGMVSCQSTFSLPPTPTLLTEPGPPIRRPTALPDIIALLSSPAADQQIVAAQLLTDRGAAAAPAVPALITTLRDNTTDVRVAAARALGAIGPAAQPAVPQLLTLLHHNDTYYHENYAVLEAFAHIGDRSIIPDLAPFLYDEQVWTTIAAARAVGILAQQPFPERDTGPSIEDANGTPVVVSAAREWWINTGQQIDWKSKATPTSE